MGEGNTGGYIDGGPGMIRPPQPKEHHSRTPSAAEKVGDKFRAGWQKLRTNATQLNRGLHEKLGMPYDEEPDDQPIIPTSKATGSPAGKFVKPNHSEGTVSDLHQLPKREGTPGQPEPYDWEKQNPELAKTAEETPAQGTAENVLDLFAPITNSSPADEEEIRDSMSRHPAGRGANPKPELRLVQKDKDNPDQPKPPTPPAPKGPKGSPAA